MLQCRKIFNFRIQKENMADQKKISVPLAPKIMIILIMSVAHYSYSMQCTQEQVVLPAVDTHGSFHVIRLSHYPSFRISINALSKKEELFVEYNTKDTGRILKQRISALTGIPIADQIIVIGGKKIENSDMVEPLGLGERGQLYLRKKSVQAQIDTLRKEINALNDAYNQYLAQYNTKKTDLENQIKKLEYILPQQPSNQKTLKEKYQAMINQLYEACDLDPDYETDPAGNNSTRYRLSKEVMNANSGNKSAQKNLQKLFETPIAGRYEELKKMVGFNDKVGASTITINPEKYPTAYIITYNPAE
jgi:uncharacterized protein YlxW (UPF0749 family)